MTVEIQSFAGRERGRERERSISVYIYINKKAIFIYVPGIVHCNMWMLAGKNMSQFRVGLCGLWV